jgi:Transposase IS116/IS110/IS902 family
MTPLTGDLGAADLAVLERYADPRALARLGQARLTALIAKASHNHQGAERARTWVDAARASLDLYRGHPAVDFTGLAAEVATEVRLLKVLQAELAAHAIERETRYQQVDPNGLARSLPGLADVGGPALAACMGDPARFANGKRFRSFTGLVPKASETGETDRKGQPMSKAGSSLLRTTLVRAADTARKQDPQLARIYYLQMTERGKDHLGAICVVAACLAERAWTVMRRGTPYVICDTDGRPVTPDQAKTIIAERWTVPPEVRARRRSKKTGKAPQKVLAGRTHGAASPAAPLHPRASGPSSEALDSRSSIGNQPTGGAPLMPRDHEQKWIAGDLPGQRAATRTTISDRSNAPGISAPELPAPASATVGPRP